MIKSGKISPVFRSGGPIPITQGLQGYWPLNGNSEDLINGNDGTDVDVTYSAGKIHQAATFDGITSEINNIGTTSSYSFINNTGVFSISLWIKPDDYTVSSEFIGSLPAGNSFNIGTQIGYFFNNSSTPIIRLDTVPILDTNSFQLINIIGNGTNCYLYRNNILIVTSPISQSFGTGNNTTSLSFGCFTGWFDNFGVLFSGKMEEVAIWSRAITENDIDYLYNGGDGRVIF